RAGARRQPRPRRPAGHRSGRPDARRGARPRALGRGLRARRRHGGGDRTVSTEPTTSRTPEPAPATSEGVESADAVVVGAGVAGLTAARSLRARGLRVVVLEAADVPGGPVRGGDLPGLDAVRVDLGAESSAVRGTAVGALERELGLDVVEPSGAGAWGYAAGRAYPLPRAGVLGIPAHPWSRDVRRAVGLGGAVRASLD